MRRLTYPRNLPTVSYHRPRESSSPPASSAHESVELPYLHGGYTASSPPILDPSEPDNLTSDAVELVDQVLQQHAYNDDHDALMTDDGDDRAATPRAIADEESKEYEQSDTDESMADLDPLAASYQTCSFEESDDEDDSEPSYALTAGPSGAAKGPDDPSNEVDHGTEPFTVPELETGMAVFINKHRLSRPVWRDLLAVLRWIQPLPDEIERLPKRVDTLKNKFKKHVPLLLMHKATLQLDP
jgi:hypothetical protein